MPLRMDGEYYTATLRKGLASGLSSEGVLLQHQSVEVLHRWLETMGSLKVRHHLLAVACGER